MNSQTARRPNKPKSTRPTRSRRYTKQTAHVEARRDGKPLIFGWGGHLSRTEKTHLQRRSIWVLASLVALAIIGTIAYAWINLNILIPNHTITSVNGEAIHLGDYRKMAALQAQLHVNKIGSLTTQSDTLSKQSSDLQKTIDATNKQIDDLNKQIAGLKADESAKRADLEKQLNDAKTKVQDTQKQKDALDAKNNDITANQIPNEQQLYTQSQVANDSADWLQQDVLIRQWESKQNNAVRAQVEPSSSAIEQALKDFKNAIPKTDGDKYQKFLDKDRVSDQDIRAMLGVQVRRANMQKYLASLDKSPSYQVQARGLTLDTKDNAQKALDRLKKGEDFAKVAKEMSKDTNTNTKGGDFGWMAPGQYALDYTQKVGGAVDNWLFDPARKVNELSPIISDAGSFHIVQVTGIEQSKEVDSKKLQDLQTSALELWIVKEKARLGSKITAVDLDTILDSSNIPSDVPSSPPSQQNPTLGG
ncbi:peptidylprolyl isomerase [Ktedonospora formicarum]|uniref:PpiC domain-containing protein n=1 Tax=Ktedonospora formicarum TaxID=2778364 RepID=A0A8J3HU45_9CHLR|nr:peptidylprolyl isomerase [Ktedonospora formicarum]GHO44027.1 hypothetical protein KSX_21900 [Ktedonospora formicarum]